MCIFEQGVWLEANPLQLSLPFWGKWHAKRDGEGFMRKIALSVAYQRQLPRGGSLFIFLLNGIGLGTRIFFN